LFIGGDTLDDQPTGFFGFMVLIILPPAILSHG
jgi:hypothetical protein